MADETRLYGFEGTSGSGQSKTKSERDRAKSLVAGGNAAIEKMKGSDPTPTSGGVKDPLVYLGQSDALRGEMRFTAGTNYYDKTAKLSEVAGQYYEWGNKTKNKFLTQLNLAGYDTSQMRDAQVAALWADYAAQASSYYKRGQKFTPWDILAMDRAQREEYMNTPRTVTQTSKSYDLSTKGDAHAIFMQAAQQLLGRDPTKSEISSFQKALNKYEQANPTVTTTTSNYLGDTLQSQTSTTKGGVKEGARQVMAMEEAKSDPEFGAYQAATTYFDAMMEMIGG